MHMKTAKSCFVFSRYDLKLLSYLMTQLFTSLKCGVIYRNASTHDLNELFCFHSKAKSDLKSKALLMKCYTFHLKPQFS